MAAIWDGGPKGSTLRFVLIALADNANDEGDCWPSVATVSRKTGLCERAVRQALRQLEADGWLTTQIGGGRGGANRYSINPAPDAPGTRCPPAPNAPAPRHHMPPPPAPDAPEPSLNHQGEPSSLAPSAPKPKKSKATRMPPDAVISEKQIQIAKEKGHTEAEAIAQFERFKDGALSKGRMYVDWDAAWRNWFTSQYFKPITYAGNGDAYGNGNRNNGFAAGGRPGYGSGIDTMLRGFQSAADRRSGGIGGDFGSD